MSRGSVAGSVADPSRIRRKSVADPPQICLCLGFFLLLGFRWALFPVFFVPEAWYNHYLTVIEGLMTFRIVTFFMYAFLGLFI